jgi:transcriptional regulator with XRE-family HTH domain
VSDVEPRKKFGKRLRYLRRDRDITQERLSELTEISVKYISRLETGHSSPSLETILKLAEALEVDVGELFKFDRK